MVGCPTELELERFLDGRASSIERAALAGHEATCDTCRRWLAEARADEAVLPELLRARGDSGEDGGLEPALDGAEPALARYRVLGRIGAGGMGVVYEAEQKNPRRRVALKVLRTAVLSDRALARFEHEAEILARLDHPGVARVFEAGTFVSHGEPQPFFAMELVEGQALVAWAAARGLARRGRLELFLQVCHAVQHAHQKGVVHRDLKPANILVTADGRPKVLDFGVARTFDAEARASALRTAAGEIVGTLPYMSPEQLSGDPLEIDTRADVYALGVILYELLAGRLPHRVDDRSMPEALRLVLESEPEPLGALDRSLAGDLETIAQKALEKDKRRRYASAQALAEDVRRHLRHEPIEARPPTPAYQLAKFARRHRALVAGLALAFLALAGGIVATSVQAARARRAERAAVEETAALGEVNALLQALIGFDPDDPLGATLGGETTLREIVERAEERLDAGALGDPRSEAKLRIAIGNFWRRLGERGPWVANLERALELARAASASPATAPATSPATSNGRREVAEALNTLGVAYHGSGDAKGAEAAWNEALEIYAALGDDADGPKVATTLSNLAAVHCAREEWDAAEQAFRRARDLHVRHLGPDSLHVSNDLNWLALLARRRGATDEAIELLEECVAITRRAGAEQALLADKLSTLAALLFLDGRAEAAHPHAAEALELRERALGPDHPATAVASSSLGALERDLGRPERALELARAAEPLLRGQPDRAADLASTAHLLGESLADLGRFGEAVPHLLEAERLLAQRLAPDDPILAACRATLGRALARVGRTGEAEQRLRSALAPLDASGASQPNSLARAVQARMDLAELMLGGARAPVEAEELFRRALADLDRLPAGIAQRQAGLRPAIESGLAKALGRLGRAEEAEPVSGETASAE